MKKILCMSMIIPILFCTTGFGKRTEQINIVSSDTYPIIQKVKTPIEEYRVSMSFVGDIIFHKAVLESSKKGQEYDFKEIFTHIKDDLNESDLIFGNLETTFAGDDKGISGTNFVFNTPDQGARDLKWAGFDILNTSNNHSLDRKAYGLKRTNDILDKEEIYRIGTYNSIEESNQAHVFDYNGIKIGFISYTYGTNGWPIPKDMPYSIKLINNEKILADIEVLKKEKPDFIVASIHWGNEYKQVPNKYQKALAELLNENNVDVIVGSHPHVMQPVTSILGENGHETLIMYSMGNFISGQRKHPRDYGGIVQLELIKKGDDKYYNNVWYTPTWVQSTWKDGRRYMRIVNLTKALENYSNETDTFFSKYEVNRMKHILREIPKIVLTNDEYIKEDDRYLIYKK
ncbi:MAG: CapA family protein [Firmicutes bacterium]|nr:CapA family protein [Bacillota bacterium]